MVKRLPHCRQHETVLLKLSCEAEVLHPCGVCAMGSKIVVKESLVPDGIRGLADVAQVLLALVLLTRALVQCGTLIIKERLHNQGLVTNRDEGNFQLFCLSSLACVYRNHFIS